MNDNPADHSVTGGQLLVLGVTMAFKVSGSLVWPRM